MKVIALERGFYGGKIQEPAEAGGEPFHIINESHLGKWMEPMGWKPSTVKPEPATADTGEQGGGSAYTAKHNGGGRWVVVDTASGEKVGDFVGASKEEAQAEVLRLNAGGFPFVKPSDTGEQGGRAEDDPTLPDA